MSSEEVVAVITPFYWLPVLVMIAYELPSMKNSRFYLVFVIGVLLVAMGQGIHVVGNHINDHLLKDANIHGQVRDTAYFYDEFLGHYLWLIGYLLIVSVLSFGEYAGKIRQKKNLSILVQLFAIINGIFFAVASIESQAVPVSLPFTVVFVSCVSFLLYKGRLKLAKQYIVKYFYLVMLVTLLVFIGWGIYFGGFPELTDVGLL